MFLKSMLRFLCVSGIAFTGFFTSSVFAQPSAVAITMEVAWEPSTGGDYSGPALTSTTDTWTLVVKLDDFEITPPNSHSPLHLGIDSSSPVPDVMNPSRLDPPYLRNSSTISYDRFNTDSPVILSDIVRGPPTGYPDWAWSFTRSVYLPQENNTDEEILTALSTIGAQFDVNEAYLKPKLSGEFRDGVATVTAIGVPPAKCELVVLSEWEDGYVAEVRIENVSGEAINGWEMDMIVPPSATSIQNYWNAEITAPSPEKIVYPVEWNSIIQAGQLISFGFLGSISPSHSIAGTKISSNICQ